jgi:oligopeptide/dipeptide ABC transporter ATP-binding protein
MVHLLEVNNLRTQFHTDRGIVNAVNNISYHINEQEIVGLVGESGCGKSVSQLSVMQLIQTPPGKIVDGEILFEGQDLLKYGTKSEEIRKIRGSKISMVFQEPMTSLNPVLTIERQLTESLELHLKMSRLAARERAVELLQMVGIPDAAKRIDGYPHQFSGGMRQRVMIAIALSCNPKIIIADEPTTALDVTTQAQLLELMTDMVNEFKASLVLVTHNLGVVARYVERIYVMYAGRIVEAGTSEEIFGNPRHPYTVALLQCVPMLEEEEGRKLVPIVGAPPNLIDLPDRCAFFPRCKHHIKACLSEPWPEMRHLDGQHYVSCRVDIQGA